MQDELNSIKYRITIVLHDIRKNTLMKKVLVLTSSSDRTACEPIKSQLCAIIRYQIKVLNLS